VTAAAAPQRSPLRQQQQLLSLKQYLHPLRKMEDDHDSPSVADILVVADSVVVVVVVDIVADGLADIVVVVVVVVYDIVVDVAATAVARYLDPDPVASVVVVVAAVVALGDRAAVAAAAVVVEFVAAVVGSKQHCTSTVPPVATVESAPVAQTWLAVAGVPVAVVTADHHTRMRVVVAAAVVDTIAVASCYCSYSCARQHWHQNRVVAVAAEEDVTHAVGGVVIAVMMEAVVEVVAVAADAKTVTAVEPQDGDALNALAYCWMVLLLLLLVLVGVVVLVLGIVEVKQEPLRSDNQFCVKEMIMQRNGNRHWLYTEHHGFSAVYSSGSISVSA
jgi:hypothetical protein